MPGAPDRMVALKRRDTAELIAEELRRLDPDDIYATAVRTPVDRLRERIAGVEHAGPGGTVEQHVAEKVAEQVEEHAVGERETPAATKKAAARKKSAQ